MVRSSGGWVRIELVLLLVWCAGCSTMKLQDDLVKGKQAALLYGSVDADFSRSETVTVLLVREKNGARTIESVEVLSDLEHDYAFVLEGGASYYIFGFQDGNGDRDWDPGEPVGWIGEPSAVMLPGNTQRAGQGLVLSASKVPPPGFPLDLKGTDEVTMGSIPIRLGTVTSLNDPRFSREQADAGMWTPLKAVKAAGAGIYFLEPHDPGRIPVLFVHGIGGTPQDFGQLIASLDRTRYQAWVFHYPSGVRLWRVADALARMIEELHTELALDSVVIAAHSMGGLVSRGAILRMASASDVSYLKLFVTFSTPWSGHEAARFGTEMSPAVMPVWIDMVPESSYLRSIREPLPPDLQHELFFSFRGSLSPFMARSNDGSVTVASQLPEWAQARARRVWGFDDTHVGILNDPEVHARFNELLGLTVPR